MRLKQAVLCLSTAVHKHNHLLNIIDTSTVGYLPVVKENVSFCRESGKDLYEYTEEQMIDYGWTYIHTAMLVTCVLHILKLQTYTEHQPTNLLLITVTCPCYNPLKTKRTVASPKISAIHTWCATSGIRTRAHTHTHTHAHTHTHIHTHTHMHTHNKHTKTLTH